ncbi:MAG TPA: outer membrane protein assembly factor BamD [Terriglobales bacterium]|nr:outer membrane protein assembly factor BamD [Terriglobales bacterium]
MGIITRHMRAPVACLVVLIAVASAGCSAKKQLTADQFFHQANDDFRSGAYTLAIDNLRNLLDQHPFSPYTEEAELKIGHAHYLDGDYLSAIVSFSDFQRRHPTSPHLPFVGYHLGMCYVRQMGSIDRDQSAAQSALAYFMTLINQYPESPYAELARAELAKCRESLAAHELYVARFYERSGNWSAARLRLLLMAAEYGDTPSAADALLKLTRNYVEGNNGEYATLAYRALRQHHPKSEETAEARALVGAGSGKAIPPTSDPIDLLLIAHGRRRPAPNYALPDLPRARETRPAPGPGPGMPSIDPFGHGNVGY